MTWDDHEVDNNYAGLDQDPDAVPPERFVARRAAAYRAYWEHMPLRRIRKPEGAFFNLYRRFHWERSRRSTSSTGASTASDQIPICTIPQREASGYCPGGSSPGAPCSASSSATG